MTKTNTIFPTQNCEFYNCTHLLENNEEESLDETMSPNITTTTPTPINDKETHYRSTRPHTKPKYLEDFVLHSTTIMPDLIYPVTNYVSYTNPSPNAIACLASINSTTEPKTYAQASTNPQWREAMKTELQAMEDNGTWEISDLPNGKNAIGCK